MAKMINCKECGKEVSKNAKVCPACGAPVKKTSLLGWIVLIFGIFIIGINFMVESNAPKKNPAEVAAEKAERERKGFHCLSGWNGSHSGVVRIVKQNLKDPDSFDHIETRISPVNDGKHTLIMKYRANNSFGGKTIGVAKAIIDNKTCGSTVTKIE